MPIEVEFLDKKMDVNIKNLNVEAMKLNDNGIELSIYDGGKHLGDLVLTNSKVIWCKGKTTPEKGKAISWNKFIKVMQGS